MKVVIIGAGNVATVLGRRIFLTGHIITQVISRHSAHAALLAGKLNCGYTSAFGSINPHSDLYIIAISDSALLEIHKELSLNKKLVVHTAGSVSKEVLKNISNNYGVLYPLQSLRKEIDAIPEIPLLVDANTEDNLTLIYDFAKTISGEVKIADDRERLKLHIGAIMVNNFTNHLYAMAETYCISEQIDFNMLKPLIRETANRIVTHSPSTVQTGPAQRKDRFTIEKHLSLLSKYPEIRDIYIKMTESIVGK